MSRTSSTAMTPPAACAADGVWRLSIRAAEWRPAPGMSLHLDAHHHPTAGGHHH